MLDIKLLRSDPKILEKKLKHKIPDIDLAPILELDDEVRKLKASIEELKSQQNAASKEIAKRKREGKDATAILEEMSTMRGHISQLQTELNEKEPTLLYRLSELPNPAMESVPISMDPLENVCIKETGQKKHFPFRFKNHLELNENLKIFDLKKSAKITGSGWPLYTDLGARLEWALLNYMLDTHRKNGFTQIIPPLLVKEETMYGAGQLPKFKDQLFKIHDKDFSLYLIPTAEVPLNGLHQDEIIDTKNLPIKYTAYTPCFRREAGAAGKQERGLIRMHQFNKVELFCITTPEESEQLFEQMLSTAEEILQGLDLHYRNMLLVTGDMSFASAKTVDIEVWLPGQDRYYEVSSISNCTDFQARRAHIRFRKQGEKPTHTHTLNGSGVATSRLMVALLENNQREDGSISIPKVLHRYLENDMTELRPQ